MMKIEDRTSGEVRKWRKFAFSLGVGAVCGGLSSFLFLSLVDGTFDQLGKSGEIAGLVALVYIVTGLALGLGLFIPNLGARFLNVEDSDELREQRVQLAFASAGMMAAGIALMIAALAAPAGPIAAPVALAGFAIAMLIFVITSVGTAKRQDEFMRAISREAAAMAFYLTVLTGGTWTLLAHLGMITGPAALDWLTMLWAVLLVAAFGVCATRGLLKPR
ncbi:hypothetical protein F7D01_03095 [Erythrobacter sp. 3-20A1M]|uniref:hypothetical protein n=1 Tax=Erythrobacter sp. 3-20A1M TaxID=2653850 RepID=UPI001BFC6F31|nr:hypothetical protein [Erythrobacter sp. 3-20A1M]QWC56209.1 hypothetical protein F7D01_03095 [Erythrobacter sp. 3-20A1M]